MKKQLFTGLMTILTLGAFAQEQPRGLVITAKASTPVKADEMVLTTRIVAQDEQIAGAFAKGNESSRKVLSYLSDLKDEVCKVQTDALRLSEKWEYRNGERYKVGYEVYQGITIHIRDFTKYEEIVTRLIELGVTGVDQVNFTSTRMEEVREEVRLKAIAGARKKAEATARALGVKLGPVEYYEELGMSFPVVYSRMEMMDAKAAGPVVAPGESEVEAEVRVRFAIFAETE